MVAYVFGLISKKLSPNSSSQKLISMFSAEFHLLHLSLVTILVKFFIWREVGVQLYFFAIEYIVVPIPFVEKTVIYPH